MLGCSVITTDGTSDLVAVPAPGGKIQEVVVPAGAVILAPDGTTVLDTVFDECTGPALATVRVMDPAGHTVELDVPRTALDQPHRPAA